MVVLWECEVKADPVGVALDIARKLRGEMIEYKMPEKREVLKVAEKRLQYTLAQSPDSNT